jgi:hypothetical protein
MASTENKMDVSPQLVRRVSNMVRRRNRELALEAVLKASLGIVFSLVIYGLLFWMGWFVGFFVSGYVNLRPWQFGAVLAGLFLVVATWSAWRRVDPLAGLKPLSNRQLVLTLVSQASPGILYFSPRHATAGAAMILLGGPANVIEAFGMWAHRIRVEGSLIEDASRLLASCETGLPAEQVREPTAALLLRRLRLITVVPRGDSSALALTDKGFAVLSGGKGSRDKPAASQKAAKAKRRSERHVDQ